MCKWNLFEYKHKSELISRIVLQNIKLTVSSFNILHYITFYSLDPKSVKMTVGYGIFTVHLNYIL
jgi:hypothetical protein